MNKIKNILIVIIMMMFVSIVDVDAAGVTIKSIKLIDHTGSATEMSEPKVSGLNINFDLAFAALNDSATYEVVLNNPTNKEYEINTEKKFGPSNYISYTYELKDKTNRIKANSEVTLNVIIKYENPVSPEKLVDGKYVENNDMGINLLNEDNPSTVNNIIFLILILLGVIGFTFLSKNIKNKEYLIIIIVLLIVPLTVFAVEKLKLTIGTKIMIAQKHKVMYYGYELVREKGDLEQCSLNNNILLNNNVLLSCENYREDTNTYFEGEKVKVNSINVLALNINSCTYDTVRREYNCPDDSLVDSTSSDFKYECSASETDFPCNEAELNKFKFNSTGNKVWYEDYGEIVFKSPNEFIMPNYDVHIRYTYDDGVPEIPLS